MNYNGGKGASGVHQQIINKMPKHKVYIETHLGGGNILIRKKPADINIAIEIDSKVLQQFMKEHSHSLEGGIGFINEDCMRYLREYSFTGEELIYCDPPYLFETRKSQSDLYKYEYDENDHIQLLNFLDSLKCFVMISGYESDLYSKLLKKEKWRLFTFNSMTRKGVRTEALWCNFNPDKYIKHDYSYIGSNFRERERIKNKTKRWINNLDKLPMDERNCILANITDNFGLELSNHF